MDKLNKNAQLWVDLLRSGELEKGVFKLQSGENKYCCFGVACIAYENATGKRLDRNRLGQISGNGLDEYPQVMSWLKLSHDEGDFWVSGNRRSLLELNDSYNLTFEQIADIIESKPEGLFND